MERRQEVESVIGDLSSVKNFKLLEMMATCGWDGRQGSLHNYSWLFGSIQSFEASIPPEDDPVEYPGMDMICRKGVHVNLHL